MEYKEGVSFNKKIISDIRHLYLLFLCIKIIYFLLCSFQSPIIIRIILNFPALYIIPGIVALLFVNKSNDATNNSLIRLIVEGFFISTLFMVILTTLMFLFNVPRSPFYFSLISLIITSGIIFFQIFIKKSLSENNNKIIIQKHESILIIVTSIVYIIIILLFINIPRLHTTDEASYIFSAKTGIVENFIPPFIGTTPPSSELNAVLVGRYFWMYLLSSFIGSTGIPSYLAGLINVYYLFMTALTLTLFNSNKNIKIVTFLLIISNPLLFSFSALALNDLTISYYITLIIYYFIHFLHENDNNKVFYIKNIIFLVINLTLIKPNLLIMISLFLYGIYHHVRLKSLFTNSLIKKYITFIIIIMIIYELIIEIPFLYYSWFIKNRQISQIFQNYLIINPIERLLRLFLKPPGNPTYIQTITNLYLIDYIDCLYRTISPESISLIGSSIIIISPILLYYKKYNKKISIIVNLSFISLLLFYLQALTIKTPQSESRYILWMIPQFIIIIIWTLQNIIIYDTYSKFFFGLVMILIININIYLNKNLNGIIIGYTLPQRIQTLNILFPILISTCILIFYMNKNYKIMNYFNRNAVTYAFIILILISNFMFINIIISKSFFYKDQSLSLENHLIDENITEDKIIFLNNYLFIRPFISQSLEAQGLVLPLPSSEYEFTKLIEIAPNNTFILLNKNPYTTWYDYSNNYMSEKFILNNLESQYTKSLMKINFTQHNNDLSIYKINTPSRLFIPLTNSSVKLIDLYEEFWVAYSWEEGGRINKPLITVNESTTNVSYKLFVGNGTNKRWRIDHFFDPIENWSNKDFISLWWYGGNTKGILKLVVLTTQNDWISYSFTDNFLGWKKLTWNINNIHEMEGSPDLNNISKITITNGYGGTDNTSGTWYLENIILETGTWKNSSTHNKDDFIVHDLIISNEKDLSVLIKFNLTSPTKNDVTILLATDRSTNIFNSHLESGENTISINYPYLEDVIEPGWNTPGGNHWRSLTFTRMLIIINNKVIFNEYISTLNFLMINILIILFSLIIISLYLFNYKLKTCKHIQLFEGESI